MQVAEKQRRLIDRYRLIEDVQERLALIVDRARKSAPFPPEEKTEAALVKGCSSRVWISARVTSEECQFRVDADSAVVKGLAAVLCEIYSGAPAADVVAVEPQILEELHLLDHLSPTRRNGLAQIRRTIQQHALGALSAGAAGAGE